MRSLRRRAGVSILEVLIAFFIVITLLAISIPSLFTAREASYRAACMNNQRIIGQGWANYLVEFDQFPFVPAEPAWRWGGNLTTTVSAEPRLDSDRPLFRYLPVHDSAHLFCCPADRGIVGELDLAGTGDRTACQSFGTSYRANSWLLDARLTGLDSVNRPLRRSEVTTSPSRMVVIGDAFWFEVLEDTGRDADWHDLGDAGNMLFLDGSVHTRPVVPRPHVGQAVFDPLDPRAAALPTISSTDSESSAEDSPE
jgi:prepilin-type processing-associated H-X9-DG protein